MTVIRCPCSRLNRTIGITNCEDLVFHRRKSPDIGPVIDLYSADINCHICSGELYVELIRIWDTTRYAYCHKCYASFRLVKDVWDKCPKCKTVYVFYYAF